jgi:hypothetical protein
MRIDALEKKFPVLGQINISKIAAGKEGFVTELLPMTEGIFLAKEVSEPLTKIILCYDYNLYGYLRDVQTVEERILDYLREGSKVKLILRYTEMNLQLYLLPPGYDSAADMMIPMLKKARDEEMARLEKQIAGLYSLPKKVGEETTEEFHQRIACIDKELKKESGSHNVVCGIYHPDTGVND